MLVVVAALLATGVIAAQVAHLTRDRRAGSGAVTPLPAAAAPANADTGPAAAPDAAAGGRDPLAAVVGALRTRRWARRGLSLLSVGLLVAAVGVLGYPFYTNMYQSRVQARLDRQLASPQLEQAYRERRVEVGDSLTRLKLPTIGVDVVVVEGTTGSALRAGAGHYPNTPLPCEVGNVAIAGHRTTYGRPFHNLDRLQPGDPVILETPVGSCTYEVGATPRIVAPTDLSVLAPTSDATLTLTTCHPKGSAAKRLIVQARMVSTGSTHQA